MFPLTFSLTDNGNSVGINTTNNNGNWYYTITSPALGEHNLVVTFNGNDIFEGFTTTGKVTVVEDNNRTYEQSPILRWHMGLIYAAKMHVESRKKKYITVVTKK